MRIGGRGGIRSSTAAAGVGITTSIYLCLVLMLASAAAASASTLARRASSRSGHRFLAASVSTTCCGFFHPSSSSPRPSSSSVGLLTGGRRPAASITTTTTTGPIRPRQSSSSSSASSSSVLLPLAAAAGAGGGGGGGGGSDARAVRFALTAAYAVGGMALALYSSLGGGGGGGVGGMEAAASAGTAGAGKGRREPPLVTGGDGKGGREFYPPLEPNRTGMLKVSAVHTLYWEESGNPQGKPVVFLHGGPGGGTSPDFRRYFDPKVYRIVVFDQRGCGQSTPHACLEENTTWDLVADIERLRTHLGVERWTVFGGSWGSTLSLTYAITHPDRVTELILRGIFMLRRKELLFYYQEGSSWIYPDAFEPYEQHIPRAERGDLMKAYHKRLTSPDEATRLAAAREWTRWEMATSRLLPDWASIRKADDAKYAEAFARIENHYFVNKGWFSEDEWILKNVHKIRHIPAVIVQGRYDSVCPTRSAFDLWRAWPEADLVIVQDAGHSAAEPGIKSELIAAADRFGKRGSGSGAAPA